MRVFIVRSFDYSLSDYGELVSHIRGKFPNAKIYAMGELGIDLELVLRLDIDGLVKPPDELKKLLN